MTKRSITAVRKSFAEAHIPKVYAYLQLHRPLDLEVEAEVRVQGFHGELQSRERLVILQQVVLQVM